MISASYSKFTQIADLYIEIIRQFYDIPRTFRHDADNLRQYIEFENAKMQPQPVGEEDMRLPMFDVKIVPEKKDPYSQASQNEMAKELFMLGVFDPMRADQAEALMAMMEFEGKEEILRKIQENSLILQQFQQLQQDNMKMRAIIQQITGRDMGLGNGQNQ